MSELRAALHAVANGDSTLTNILTGGVYKVAINRDSTPDVWDNRGAFQPCASLTMGTHAAAYPGAVDMDVGRDYFQWYVYGPKDGGYDTIESARRRLITLFDLATVSVDTGSVAEIHYIDGSGDLYDPDLRANFQFIRFEAIGKRS